MGIPGGVSRCILADSFSCCRRTTDLAQGLTLHHLPGHTAGLCGLQINLINSGTYIFVSE